jgi:hypothetical protein
MGVVTNANLIWQDIPYDTERAPDGPSATAVLSQWQNDFATGSSYRIFLSGADVAEAGTPPPPPQFGPTWFENNDAPALLPGQTTSGEGNLTRIVGTLTDGSDVDLYKIIISEPNAFSATTIDGVVFDSQLFLFKEDGRGKVMNDDVAGGQESLIGHAFVTQAGVYYLAVTRYDHDAMSGGNEIWRDTPAASERIPDGPGAAGIVDAWAGGGTPGGDYQIFLTGAQFAQSSTLTMVPHMFVIGPGAFVSGGVSELAVSDNLYLVARPGVVLTSSQDPLAVTCEAYSVGNNPSMLRMLIESRSSAPNVRQIVECRNFSTSSWTLVDTTTIATGANPDTVITPNVPNPSQHFQNDLLMRVRVRYRAMGAILVYPWQVSIDEIAWRYTP